MTTLVILRFLGIFAVYTGVTLALPALMFRRILRGRSLAEQFLMCYTFGNFYIINIVFLLQLLHISNFFTLAGLTAVLSIVIGGRVNRIPLKQQAGNTWHLFGKLLRGRMKLKSAIFLFLGKCAAGIKRLAKFFYRHIVKNPIQSMLLLGIGVCLCWIYGRQIILVYGYRASDIPVHMSWINEMSRGKIFAKGVYPFGFHCMIYYLHAVFRFDTYVILCQFFFAQVIFMHLVLLAMLKQLCKTKYIPYIGTFVFLLGDQDEKMMAYAEYYYFSGHHEKAVEYAEMYLDHPDIMLKMSACLIYTFANLSLNHIHSARMGLNRLTENLNQVMKGNTDRKAKAFGVFVAVAAHTLLHLPVGDIPPLSDYVGEFKKGKQLWGVYVLAHKAYLDREYQRSLGIVEACLMTTKEIYPISMIYLNLVAAMNAMNLMQTELAKKYFMQAWEIARPDGLIEGIGEHHGLLQGLIETCLKKDYPKDYERIIAITYKFSFGWRRIHNPDTNEYVADNLTTTEFTIAMLASRGWTNQEIADYMQITPRTVKQHMTCIFNKMSISNRKQLKDYMLR